MRAIDSTLSLLVGMIIGAGLYWFYMQNKANNTNPVAISSHQILLERINRVAKLITVEGEFSNIHHYEEPGWKGVLGGKKVLAKVQARVSVGYDLKKATYRVDSLNKTIYIENLPEPEIIAIDDKLEYYDISESMFNKFSERDYNSITTVARQQVEKAAKESKLLEEAKNQGIETLEIMRILVEQGGWQLIVSENEPKKSLEFEKNDSLKG